MYYVLISVKCILNMSVLCLSLFFLNHRFCESAELRASFHHVKMLLSSPCPYLSACTSWHVHTCALCTCALSHQLFCLVCVWSTPSVPSYICADCTRTVPQPAEIKGALLSLDSDLRQGLAVIYWAAMGWHGWIFCVSHHKHRNNSSACSPNKWCFCKLPHACNTCMCRGRISKQDKPLHSSISGSSLQFFPAF